MVVRTHEGWGSDFRQCPTRDGRQNKRFRNPA